MWVLSLLSQWRQDLRDADEDGVALDEEEEKKAEEEEKAVEVEELDEGGDEADVGTDITQKCQSPDPTKRADSISSVEMVAAPSESNSSMADSEVASFLKQKFGAFDEERHEQLETCRGDSFLSHTE